MRAALFNLNLIEQHTAAHTSNKNTGNKKQRKLNEREIIKVGHLRRSYEK